MLKSERTYEAFNPEEVGLQRQIVIGKHSGKAAIKAKFDEYGITLSEEEAAKILAKVRNMAIGLKRSLFDKELVYIYEDYQLEKKQLSV
jgi:homocitrate synthase NifV